MARSRHRLRPAISDGTRAKREIEIIDLQIAHAKWKGAGATVERLEKEKLWVLVNSLR